MEDASPLPPRDLLLTFRSPAAMPQIRGKHRNTIPSTRATRSLGQLYHRYNCSRVSGDRLAECRSGMSARCAIVRLMVLAGLS